MPSHVVDAYQPANGLEIIEWICELWKQELQKNANLAVNLAYAQVRVNGALKIELSSSGWGEPEPEPMVQIVAKRGSIAEGVEVSEVPLSFEIDETLAGKEVSPNQSRARLSKAKAAAVPLPGGDGSMSGVAGTPAGVETYPEKFRR